MTDVLITGIIGVITTIVSGYVSWFSARKKYYTEVDHNYIENLGKGLETYDSIISHNKTEIEYLMKDNSQLRREVEELRKQVLDLTLNICLDLSCPHRLREKIRNRKPVEKVNDRLDEIKEKTNNT